MISINIPVYNIDARPLVFQLLRQAKKLSCETEIRVYDDRSQENFRSMNRELDKIPGVFYREMEKNHGRAAIRNKMGGESTYKFLLFIDADSKITSEEFLEKYLKVVNRRRVICGGTVYSPEPPANPEKRLRWYYGSEREAISAEQRNQKKGFIITSNNFLIEKKLFESTGFNERLEKYGHEDTLLGFDLFRQGIQPSHIENPVEHTGLEDSNTFLTKTREALESLHSISNGIARSTSSFNQQVPFLRHYRKITRYLPSSFLRLGFIFFHSSLKKNLTGKNPKLFWFDLYRLCYYAIVSKKAT